MIDVLDQTEGAPTSWPIVSGLSMAAAELDQDMLWQRIESYIAHRWGVREVVWVLTGEEDDEWRLPLTPLISHEAEKWESGAWVSTTIAAGPVGLCLPSDGTFRVTAQIGGAGAVPAAVYEAFRRLAEYSTETEDRGGVSDYSVSLGGGAIQTSYSRNPAFMARALINSGAADLLRPYRRA
ncbi:hypothetical protein [Mameliella sp.]|uniref:hypothetical protein n=1 Tax=Mameliella sp. TaxID=1924940 RepID=UPI003BAA86B8